MTTIARFREKLSEVGSAATLEHANLFQLQALALNTTAEIAFQRVCLFVVASALSRLAMRLESEPADMALTADYEYLLSLFDAALRAKSYPEAERSLLSIVDALWPLTSKQ